MEGRPHHFIRRFFVDIRPVLSLTCSIPQDKQDYNQEGKVPRGLFNTVTPGLSELKPDHQNIRELKAVTMVTNEDFFNTVQTEKQNVARHLCPQQCFLVCHHLKQTTTATQPECHQTKGLMSRITMHVRFKTWYFSWAISAKQQREIIKFCVF